MEMLVLRTAFQVVFAALGPASEGIRDKSV
jgi:hypothetical protein